MGVRKGEKRWEGEEEREKRKEESNWEREKER